MPAALWKQIVDGYVNAQIVAYPGTPDLDACRNARAEYMVSASFALRPSLPGIAGSSGGVPAQAHVTVTNCVTGDLELEQTIPLDSDPSGDVAPGDFDAVPETTWLHVAPAELARHPIFFQRVSHIKRVESPFAYIDTAGGALVVGDSLRAFATASGGHRVPIVLTVTSTEGRYAQAVFSIVNGTPPPNVGDFVEPIVAQRPLPTPVATPARR